VIINVAVEQLADLIVMGVHGAASLTISTHLPWTTSHYVVCHARCPVLLLAQAIENSSEKEFLAAGISHFETPVGSWKRHD